MGNNRRFIEESFPVKEVSVESAKEKIVRHGHISTIHIWWARRPLASSRATNYAALVPASEDINEWNRRRQFIIDFSKWENSANSSMIQKAREDILKANGGKPPKVLDPFAGGGAIPLEALRLGCETYASDYNPVATLILKCTLEYPPKYSRLKKVADGWIGAEKVFNPLLEDVKKWGNWVLDEAVKEIGRFYPAEADGSIPIAFIWARTIPCQNPACGAEIPLMRQFWLTKKDKKKVSMFPYVVGKEIKFKIVGTGYEPMPEGFDPENGTVERAVANCPVCGGIVDDKTTRALFHNGKSGERLVAIALHGSTGKHYRIATSKDSAVVADLEQYLKDKRSRLTTVWGIDPIPDEEAPGTLGSNAMGDRYNFYTFGDYFNSRQKLVLITLADKIRTAHEEIARVKGGDEGYAKAVVSYLALALSRVTDFTSNLCRWHPQWEFIPNTFARQALPMAWDYAELNPFSPVLTGTFASMLRQVLRVLEEISKVSGIPATVTQATATSLDFPDNSFDAVFTDPPYYDNVIYATLSDFFYVWLKRIIGNLYPELFATPLTPKKLEIISDRYRHDKDKIRAKQFFEEKLREAFIEISRVLRQDGIATIVYAHKSTAGWETLINSLLDSGLVISGAWPLSTEMGTRLNANETASLASSIYIIARKMVRQPTGFYNNVQEELKQHLNKKLERLWQEGIGGADFFIAAIGSAIEVFGKYEKVMDYEGNIVRADRLLEDVRHIATDYAVRQILHNGFAGEISDLTRFYVLYRWNYAEAKVEFDEARKLSQSCNIDLAKEWNRGGFVRKDKEFIKLLGPQERQLEDLKNSNDLIDVLHAILLLWEKGKRDDMVKLLHKSGYGKGEAFYRVAQAISETLPIESKEKKLLDGFLAGKERVREEIRKETTQGRLL